VQARWQLMTAARLDAAAALAMGLADRVVASAALDAAVAAELALLARVEPAALRVTKQLTLRNQSTPLAPALDAAAQDFAALLRAGSAQEGIAASRERRPPRWHIGVPALPEFT